MAIMLMPCLLCTPPHNNYCCKHGRELHQLHTHRPQRSQSKTRKKKCGPVLCLSRLCRVCHSQCGDTLPSIMCQFNNIERAVLQIIAIPLRCLLIVLISIPSYQINCFPPSTYYNYLPADT